MHHAAQGHFIFCIKRKFRRIIPLSILIIFFSGSTLALYFRIGMCDIHRGEVMPYQRAAISESMPAYGLVYKMDLGSGIQDTGYI